jgi:alanine dehydrogenase
MQNNYGGKGILLGGLAGVPPAEVIVIGAGIAGLASIRAFLGMGAHITVLDIDPDALQEVHILFPEVVSMYASKRNILRTSEYADVIIACASLPGHVAPKIVTREVLRAMKPRSLVMDIAIDQGGNLETSRPTDHDNPTFVEEGVIHYCVPNLSSVLSRTASHAFAIAARPYLLEIAEKGIDKAMKANPAIQTAINTHNGKRINLLRLTDKNGAK